MEFVGNLIVFFSALFAVLERDTGTIAAGTVGLSVSYALQVFFMLFCVLNLTHLLLFVL